MFVIFLVFQLQQIKSIPSNVMNDNDKSQSHISLKVRLVLFYPNFNLTLNLNKTDNFMMSTKFYILKVTLNSPSLFRTNSVILRCHIFDISIPRNAEVSIFVCSWQGWRVQCLVEKSGHNFSTASGVKSSQSVVCKSAGERAEPSL